MPLGAYSEVGKLRRVMVHRPGLEHSRLTPSNAEELLFDDVLWVARAKAEHDMFCEAMRDRGVEVFEAEELLAQALASPEARDWVCGHILSEREVGITAAQRAREWAGTADPALVAEFLIGGITKADIQQDVGLVWESADPTSMLLPPLPNFLFQRDPSCWIFDGVTINPMTKPARPRAMYLALGIATLIYLAVSLGVFGTLTVDKVISSGGPPRSRWPPSPRWAGRATG